jgi:PAS domain S-box-containing protein
MQIAFEIDSAKQGRDGFEMVKSALALGRPYSMAFVDMRMEPGWNGIETIRNMWSVCPDLQVVLCSAYSDYSWSEIVQTLGATDNLVILRKPFDNIEVLQLALALSKKWEAARLLKAHLEKLDREVTVRTQQAVYVTEKLKEETVAKSQANERFFLAFHAMPLPMAMINVDRLTWVDVNEAFAKLSGFSVDALLAQSPGVMTLLNRQPSSLLEMLKQSSRVHGAECEFNSAEGATLKVLLSREFFICDRERHALMIMQDVTAQRRSEERLRVGMKLEAIGRLSAGVAHDFNNIMTVVEGHTSLLLNDRNLPTEYRGSLQKVADASRRASDVVKQLLSVGRQQASAARPVNVAEHVEQEVSLLRRLVGEHTQIRVDSSLGLPPVVIDPANLDQILINLVVNARDAMPNGGSIQIRVRSVDVEKEDILNVPGARCGQFIVIQVEDSGQMIDPAIRRSILDPMSVGVMSGESLAMGFSTVMGLVKQQGGWIDIASQGSQGACVSVYLPEGSAVAEQAKSEPQPAPVTMSGVGKAALIVEDQDSVRAVLKQMLTRLGFKVYEASSGMKALEVWRRCKSEICLLITDIMMPGGIGGVELGRQLAADSYGLKIIYSTGYNAESVEGVTLLEGVNYLPKPYDAATLSSIVQKLFVNESIHRTGPILLPKPEQLVAAAPLLETAAR